MPKVRGTMADVSTERTMIEPDDYQLLIKEVRFEEKPGTSDKPHGQQIYTVILAVDDPTNDFNGRQVWDTIYWLKKDGTENEFSKANLKRYFEAAFGADEVEGWDEDDYDTDRLINKRVMGQVYIDSYTSEKNGVKTEGQSNKVKNISPIE